MCVHLKYHTESEILNSTIEYSMTMSIVCTNAFVCAFLVVIGKEFTLVRVTPQHGAEVGVQAPVLKFVFKVYTAKTKVIMGTEESGLLDFCSTR